MNTTDICFPSNRVADIERQFHSQLDSLYGHDEVRSIMRLLFEAFFGWDTTQYLLNRSATVNQSDLLRLHWALHDLQHWRPVQQIIGYTLFAGCRIEVDQHTLIPRPETEELVLRTLEFLNTSNPTPIQILDLCTGSGCIAIALAKKLPASHITAVDLSPSALHRARRNAQLNNVQIDFLQADLLSPLLPQQLSSFEFNLIISNPPYVCESERLQMRPNVLQYEPEMALFVPDNDPLRFYRPLAALAASHLKPSGHLVAEINERFAPETLQLFTQFGFTGTVERDFRGKERYIHVHKPY